MPSLSAILAFRTRACMAIYLRDVGLGLGGSTGKSSCCTLAPPMRPVPGVCSSSRLIREAGKAPALWSMLYQRCPLLPASCLLPEHADHAQNLERKIGRGAPVLFAIQKARLVFGTLMHAVYGLSRTP